MEVLASLFAASREVAGTRCDARSFLVFFARIVTKADCVAGPPS